MKFTRIWYRLCLLLISIILSTYAKPTAPGTPIIDNREAAPILNLGYARYQGYYDSEFDLNLFKGCAATANTSSLTLPETAIDTNFPASVTLLLPLASCAGKHLRSWHRRKTAPSSKLQPQHHYVHNPALRNSLQYTASIRDQVMKTACFSMSTHPRMRRNCQSFSGFVCWLYQSWSRAQAES